MIASRAGIATAAVANLARSTQPFPLHLLGDATESSLALLILRERLEELGFPKIRPQRLGDVDLGVGALPQKEVRDAHFAAGADEQIGIRNTDCGERAAERGRIDRF